MKRYLILLTLVILASSCQKDEFRSQWDDSYEKFKKFEQANAKNYMYAVVSGSWTGYSSRTVLFISAGKVTARVYNRYAPGQNGQPQMIDAWSENELSLNSHEEGAPVLTLDEIYLKAKNEWLKVNKEENTITLETNNEGMISAAGYRPKNCADDCFRGVIIEEISPYMTASELGK